MHADQDLTSSYAVAAAALAAVPTDVDRYRAIDDRSLLDLAARTAAERRLIDTHSSLIAGEIARRSDRSLGSAGLAQRTGHRTPEELVRVTAQTTKRDAGAAVRVGRVLQELAPVADAFTGEVAPVLHPWLAPVASAVAAGRIGMAAAEAIGLGLGKPSDGVSPQSLLGAAIELCSVAATLDPDRVLVLAREARDLLDEAGIGDRERERYEKRSLRVTRRADGMVHVVWILDPESAAVVVDLHDRATSPRRGGPRFVDGPAADLAQSILDDARTPEQLGSDVFLHLLQAGADADDSELLGTGGAQVNILVPQRAVADGEGHGFIAGFTDPISIASVRRNECGGSSVNVTLDESGQPSDVTAEQRFFNRKARRALASRDGGCRFPGCERPPSWAEAHHITYWSRGGKSTIANGILLCRHHHLLVHNNGWEIAYEPVPGKKTEYTYWLIPPADIHPDRQPIPMPSKSPVWNEMRRAAV